jgi:hypothetical protein
LAPRAGIEPATKRLTVFCTTAVLPWNCLVEYPGIEPGVPKGVGFTVRCITIDASTPYCLTLSRLCRFRRFQGAMGKCVLKNTVCGISAHVNSMPFNTLGFFIPHKELHRLGRPFRTFIVVQGPRFLYHSVLRI